MEREKKRKIASVRCVGKIVQLSFYLNPTVFIFFFFFPLLLFCGTLTRERGGGRKEKRTDFIRVYAFLSISTLEEEGKKKTPY